MGVLRMRAARHVLEGFGGQLAVRGAKVGKHDQRIDVGVAFDESQSEVVRHLYSEFVLNGPMRLSEQPRPKGDVGLGAGEHRGECIGTGILGGAHLACSDVWGNGHAFLGAEGSVRSVDDASKCTN
jgi:hypothetical protein